MPVCPHGGAGWHQFLLTEAPVAASFSSRRPRYAPVSAHAVDYKMLLLSDPAVLLKRVLDHLSNLLNGGAGRRQLLLTEALAGASFSSRKPW